MPSPKNVNSSQPFVNALNVAFANGLLTFDLSQTANIIGTGQVAPRRVSITLDGTGKAPTTAIWFNDQLNPSGTTYLMQLFDSGGNFAANFGPITLSGASVDLSTLIPIIASGGIVSFPNPIVLMTGNSLAAAYAALPSTGGTIWVPQNYNETLLANITMNKVGAGFHFTGPAHITMNGFSFVIPSGTNGAFITGEVVGSTTPKPTVWLDFGASVGTAIKIGDTSGSTGEITLSNFSVVATVGTCIAITRVFGLNAYGIRADNATPTCVIDGNSNGDTFEINFHGCHCTYQIKGGARSVHHYGGFMESINANACIDIQNGYGCVFDGVYIDLGQAVNLANSSSVFGNRLRINNTGLTTLAVIGASAHDNFLDFTGDTSGTVTDNSLLAQNNVVNIQGRKGGYGRTILNRQLLFGALTGNSADQVIYQFTIPANTVGPGKGIRIYTQWLHNTGTASITFKINFGGSIAGGNLSGGTAWATESTTGVDNSSRESLDATITNNDGVQNAQNGFYHRRLRTANVANVDTNTVGDRPTTNPAVNFANSVLLTVTGNVANTDTFTGAYFLVELIQ